MAKSNTKKKTEELQPLAEFQDVIEQTAEAPKVESKGTQKQSAEEDNAALGFEGMIETPSKDVGYIGVRATFIPKPKVFYFEPRSQLRAPDAKSEKNEITKGRHQIDPNRSVSKNPVMPNIKLLKEKGNPFPKDASDESVVTTPAWAFGAELAHVAYNVVKSAKEPMTIEGIMEEVQKRTKAGMENGKPSSKAWQCLTDVMRDMRLYGIVQSNKIKALRKSTLWQVVDKTPETA